MNEIHLHNVIALTENLPNHKLRRGQVGTVVEILDTDVFEVEFSDNDGHTYAMLALHADKLMVLYYTPTTSFTT